MMTPPLEPNRNAVRSGSSAIGKLTSGLPVIHVQSAQDARCGRRIYWKGVGESRVTMQQRFGGRLRIIIGLRESVTGS
jgi:hypothetical protein